MNDLNRFMDELESSSPAPGGGSASALVGAVSASLGLMVSRLTEGKKGYESRMDEIKRIIAELGEVKNLLMDCIQEDIDAFNAIGKARKLPRNTEDEKNIRTLELEKVLKEAIRSPWRIALNCQRSMRLNMRLLDIGNRNASSDAAAGIMLSKAALDSALLNVRINLKYMKRDQYTEDQEMKLSIFSKDSQALLEESIKKINGMLKPEGSD